MKHIIKVILLVVMVLIIPNDTVEAKEYYQVKSGDTLWSISNSNNVGIDKIKEWNKLKSDIIVVGQRLIISEKKEDKPVGNKIYTVKAGDTLWKISIDHKVTVQELASWNNLKDSIIVTGQKLSVNGKATDGSAPNPGNDNKDNMKTYTVKKGESLWSISRDHKVTIQELIDWNKLTDTTLLIGQKLQIKAGSNTENTPETSTAVTTDNLNLRTSANTNATILTTIPKGSTVDVIKKNGTWWEIKFGNQTGFAHSGYLTESKAEVTKARVTSSGLYMRSSGSASGNPVMILTQGSVVEVLDDTKLWWKISFDGKVGYSNSNYLTKMSGSDSETQKPNGKVVILDPGHGGPDPGAINGGIQENHLNMTFAYKTRDHLQRLGYTVYLTRDGNNDSCAGTSGATELQCRLDLSESKNGDVFVSIHNNSFSPGVRGSETFYSTGNTAYSNQSKALADAVHRSYQPAFGSSNRGVKTADFYVLRNSKMPSILLEIGFLSDVNGDLPRLTNPTVQNNVSKAIAEGIHNYMK